MQSLVKTRWKIEPDQVTVYPFGLSYILAAVLAIIFAVGYFVYVSYLQNSIASSTPLLIIMIAFLLLFIAWAGTSIEFDISGGIMRKKLFGVLPIRSISFSKIYGISPVSNTMGGYKYKVFKKDDRYGKGMLVSCAYGKSDDKNAIAFVEEVVTPIHKYLEAHDSPEDFKPVDIAAYKFFDVQGSSYILKKNKVGSIILGIVLLSIGIHELTPDAWLGQGYNIGRICLLLFTIVGGPAVILTSFTEIRLDKSSRILIRSNPTGLGNKTFLFKDFNGMQTVRRSTNLIYSGTDIQLYFLQPTSQKEDVIVLQSFFSTRKVERFIAEVNSIII